MVESVYTVINTYRNEGRINYDAALYALSVPGEDDAKVLPLNLHTRCLIDALMYANTCVGRIIGYRQLSHEKYWGIVDECIKSAVEYLEGSGLRTLTDGADRKVVSDYIVACVVSNYDSRKKGETFCQRVCRVGRELGYDSVVIGNVYTWYPYKYPVAFCKDPSSNVIAKWLKEEAKW